VPALSCLAARFSRQTSHTCSARISEKEARTALATVIQGAKTRLFTFS
jgi:hypothetical protein